MQPPTTTPTRRLVGVLAGVALVAACTLALLPGRDAVTVATPALVLVAPGIVAALLGGRLAGTVTAVSAALALDLAFIEPYGTLTVHLIDDVVALVAFCAVTLTVATLVAQANDRRRAAEQRAWEVMALSSEKTALEQAEDARRALLRSVSHDLRTPLAAIRAITSDLQAGAVYDEQTRHDLLDVVSDEAERLDRLVANLLSLSRIEAGALTPDRQAVDLDELCADRVRRLSRLLRPVHVETCLPPVLPLIDADYVLVDQVLTNLLENAVRHTPPGSTVRIEAIDRGDVVDVSVSDQGEGVPPAEREVIFEPFRTGSSAGGRAGGHARNGSDGTSGIGLAICKAVALAHGGDVTVGDTPDGGARFTVRLPVHQVTPGVGA